MPVVPVVPVVPVGPVTPMVASATLSLAAGRHTLVWRPPHAGTWMITLAATDLAGNRASTGATATILAAPPRHHHKKTG